MQRADAIRLRHMLDAAHQATEFIAGRTRADLDQDAQLTFSLLKAVEIIGEAASKVSQPCRRSHPEIPWQDIVAMRNRLIHAYFDVNLDVVWKTATEDVPALTAQLMKILPDEAGP